MYRVNRSCSFGTSWRGDVMLPPAFMIERFGDERSGSDTHTSGSWLFESDAGEVFTVYDWHCTLECNVLTGGWPTIEEFWASREPIAFHIGGMPESEWQKFREWLQTQYWLYCMTPEERREIFQSSSSEERWAALQGQRLSLQDWVEFLRRLSPKDLLACLSSKQVAGIRKMGQAKRPPPKSRPRRERRPDGTSKRRQMP
jgi:hypothetical protein